MKLRELMLLIIGPLVALAGYLLWDNAQRLKANIMAAEHSVAAAGMMDAMANLMHELQLERGYSSGFLGSGGDRFGAELAAQRLSTNAVRDQVLPVLTSVDAQAPGLSNRIGTALADLTRIRDTVDSGATQIGTVADYYTAIINDLLAGQKAVLLSNENGALRAQFRIGSLLSRAKEHAGRERAAGATGLAAGQFAQTAHQDFITLVAAQNMLLDLISVDTKDTTLTDTLRGSDARIS